MQTCSPSILFMFSTHTTIYKYIKCVPVVSCPWQLQAKSLKSSLKCRRPFTRHAALALALVRVHVLASPLRLCLCSSSSSSCSVSMLLLSWLGSSHIWPSAWQVIRGIILIARINPWMNGQPDSTSLPLWIPRFLAFPCLSIPAFRCPKVKCIIYLYIGGCRGRVGQA